MGKRGPAPKPTALRVLHGDRASRINANEPVPADRPVRCPAWLSKDARRVWKMYAPDLVAKGVMTAWDVEAFARYCDAVVRRRDASAKLDELGQVVEQPINDKEGRITGYKLMRNPWQLVWKSADEVCQRIGARFGLTPSERSQISIERPPTGGGVGRLLS